MGEVVTLTGMILVASPMKEYDKRIELLTKERGRISAFGNGRSGSRCKGRCRCHGNVCDG